MKSNKTLQQESYKKVLAELIATKPEARLVKNKYRVMSHVLSSRQMWKNTVYQFMEKYAMHDLMKDIIYIDRQIRKATEGMDSENKQILEEEYLLENGYEVGVDSQVDKLKTL